ncbi:uncharacterized protein LOC143913749 [Arctopsyche grandis]|uniref:uncharacterized protein LOC143913749 n=1 Tax=Arctopsyche grandis TaxID=121162 RepID=UPI00406D9D85
MKIVEAFLIVSNLILISSTPDFDVNVDSKDATTFDEFNIPWDGENYAFGYLTSQKLFRMEKGYWVTAPNGVMFLMVVGAYSKILYDNRIEVIEYYSDLNGYHVKVGMPLEEYLEDYKIPRPQPTLVTTSPSPFEIYTIPNPSSTTSPQTYPPPLAPTAKPVDKALLGSNVMDKKDHGDFGNTLAKILAKNMKKMKREILMKMAIDLKIQIQ